jgi:hypothetical protein
MSDLDGFVLGQVQPHFIPGESARCAAGAWTFRTAAEIAAAKLSGSAGLLGAAVGAAASVGESTPAFLVATTERLYFIQTEARLVGQRNVFEPVNKGVQTVELAEISAVTMGKEGGQDWVSFVQKGTQELKYYLLDEPELTMHAVLKHEYVPWLARAVSTGELRTPERLARIAERDARLAAEQQARMQAHAVAQDAHIRATIARQPQDKFILGFALVGIAAIVGLFTLYQLSELVGALSGVASSSSDIVSAERKGNKYESKRQAELLKESTTRAVFSAVFALGGVAAVGGCAFGAFRTRKSFLVKNRELRQQYGLPLGLGQRGRPCRSFA